MNKLCINDVLIKGLFNQGAFVDRLFYLDTIYYKLNIFNEDDACLNIYLHLFSRRC